MNEDFSILSLLDKLKNLELSEVLQDILDRIAPVAKSLGRFVAKQIMCLYYVLKEGELTDSEKILIYAAMVYIVAPKDLLPRKVFHFLGITDDALALAYVVGKVKGKITPEIMEKVNLQLELWFGSEEEKDEADATELVRNEIMEAESVQCETCQAEI